MDDPKQMATLTPEELGSVNELMRMAGEPLDNFKDKQVERNRRASDEAMEIALAGRKAGDRNLMIVNVVLGLLLAVCLIMFVISLRRTIKAKRKQSNRMDY